MRTVPRYAALVTAVLALAACSTAGADGEAPTSTTGAAAATVTVTGTPSEAAGGSEPQASIGDSSTDAQPPAPPASSASAPAEEHDDGIAWVPFGPATSGVPSPRPASYGQLYARGCDGHAREDLEDNDKHLYEGALAACRAVGTNAPADWAIAETELGKVDTTSVTNCMDSEALRLLQQLVAEHRRHPGAAPSVRPARQATACQTRVDSVSLTDDGSALDVQGLWLWGVSSVTVNGVAASHVEPEGEHVLVPLSSPLDPGSTVTVVVVQGDLPPQKATFTVPDTPAPPSDAGSSSP